jgi:pyocin large subunit-like protein
VPFEDNLVLQLHYGKHKNEFTFGTEIDYQTAADAFMGGAVIAPVRECTRPNGERVRFNRRTREFGVVAPSGWLKTFHKPSEKYISFGYFSWECSRNL